MRVKVVIIEVKDFAGHLFIRRVWDATESKIYITDEDGFLLMEAGRTDLALIGFPLSDGFEYDEAVAAAIRLGHDPDRSKLRPVSV